jgi:Bacterial Ig-like domain (group 3)
MHGRRLWYAPGAALLLMAGLGAASVPSARADPARPASPARLASPARPAAGSSAAGTSTPLTSFPVGYLLCDEKGWNYRPEPVSYYQDEWTKLDGAGTDASLADYYGDESFGQLSTAGSQVLGWYQMSMSPQAYGPSQLGYRWLSCADAALAAGVDVTKFKSLITVQPQVASKVTGSGIPAWTSNADWPPGHAHPNPETFTVDSTSHWPAAPFYLNLTSIGPYGQASLVTKVSGDTVTVIRGDDGTQAPRAQLTAVPAGAVVASITNDDQAAVGPQPVYLEAGGQPCASGHGSCPVLSFSGGSGSTEVMLGVGGLGAAAVTADGTTGNGVGDSAHEIGHTTGYFHSRALSTSQTDYRDCYDQMSYNACGLPDLPALAGPPDTIIGFDAPDLELHGWIPAARQYNASDAPIGQATITLHALSDPGALHDPGYLDAHLPAKVLIEDTTPNRVIPTVPPSNCDKTGYQCEDSSYYTVEYRQKFGFDTELTARDNDGTGALSTGAVILHLVVPDPANCDGHGDGDCNTSYLVDSQPGVSNGGGRPKFLPNAGAFQPGADYADPAHHVYLAVNSFDASARSARVTVSSSPILPALVVNGPAQAEAGAKATLQVTLTAGGAPVPDQKVTLRLGTGRSCSASTGSTGAASCQVTAGPVTGITTVTASFAGDQAYHPAEGAAQTQVWTAPASPVEWARTAD